MEKKPNVSRISIGNDSPGKLDLTIGIDVVDYMESSRVFGKESLNTNNRSLYQRRMVSIPNKKNEVITPMFLTIGNKNELFIVSQDGPNHGWIQYELSEHFGKNTKVLAVGAAYTENDKFTIAVSVEDPADTGTTKRSKIFVAYNLSSKTVDWSKINWIDYGTRGNVNVSGVQVIYYEKIWTVVLIGHGGLKEQVYLINDKQAEKRFDSCIVFDAAKEYQEITSFKTGIFSYAGSGLFVLGRSENDERLTFRPFPAITKTGKAGSTPPVVQLPCPKNARVLETGYASKSGTSLFIGGDGIDLISSDEFLKVEKARISKIADKADAGNIQELLVAQTEKSAIVWSLDLSKNLRQFSHDGPKNEWSNLLLRTNVQSVAPTYGDDKVSASLIIVDNHYKTSFLMRDKLKGNWTEMPLTVKDTGKVTPVTCYSTAIRLYDDAGVTKPKHVVSISSPLLANVIINNQSVFLGPGIPSYEVETDDLGAITIYDKAKSFTPATYRINVSGYADLIDINPATNIFDKFKTLSADELKNAKIENDSGKQEFLLPENYRTGANSTELNAISGTLNSLAKLKPEANTNASGVYKITDQKTSAANLARDQRAENRDYVLALSVSANGTITMNDSVFNQVMGAVNDGLNFFKGVGDSISDFFTGITQKISDGWSFVVKKIEDAAKGAYQFICKIGNAIKEFIVNTLDEIGGFFTWLWEKIKVGIEKVWEFVKFLFNWKDILLMRNALLNYCHESVTYVGDSIPGLKKSTLAQIDKMLTALDSLRDQLDVPNVGKNARLAKTAAENTPSQAKEHNDSVNGNSIFTWIMNKFSEFLSFLIKMEASEEIDRFIAAIKNFVSGTLSGLFTEFIDKLNTISQNISTVLGENFSISNLTFDQIKKIILVVGFDVVEGLINSLRLIISGIFDLVHAGYKAMEKMMFGKISFPFIEELYKLITGETVDTSFTIMEVVTLLLAVPTTIAVKIMKLPYGGKASGKPAISAAASADWSFKDYIASQIEEAKLMAKLCGVFTPIATSLMDIFSVGTAYVSGTVPDPKTFGTLSALSLTVGFISIYTEAMTVKPSANSALVALEITRIAVGGFAVILSGIFWFAADEGQKKGLKTMEAISYGIRGFLRIPIFVMRPDKTRNDTLEFTTSLFKDTAKVFACATIAVKNPKAKALLAVGNVGCAVVATATGLADYYTSPGVETGGLINKPAKKNRR